MGQPRTDAVAEANTMALLLRPAAGLSLCCAVFGCGGHAGPTAEIEKTVPAAGVVTYGGQPLENYQVTFYPSDGRRAASGKTNAEGRFTLGTNAPDDGAPPGSHRVTVVYVGPESTVEPGKEEPMPLPPPSVAIPEKYSNADTSEIAQTIPDGGAPNIRIELP